MTSNLSLLLDDPRTFFISVLLSVPAFLIGLTLHEAAHAYAAYRLGDPTAQMLGRLSLNPLRHLDPLGTLALVLVGFGWARPVPVDSRYFKHMRRDDLIVSIAGIATNLALCLLSTALAYALLPIWLRGSDASYLSIPARLVYQAPYYISYLATEYGVSDVMTYLIAIIMNIATINLVLGVFNLIPLPPLDGYHVLNDLVLKRTALFVSRNATMIAQVVLIVLLVSGKVGDVLSYVIVHVFQFLGGIGYQIIAALGAI